MADVFEAERADGEFVSRVAVKVIKTECLNEQLLQQFAVERQTLTRISPGRSGDIDRLRST